MLNRITVVSWNVAHQIYERPIPHSLGAALIHINADVMFLTEFVDGSSRRSFRRQLHDAGYIHQAITKAPAKHNRVFAASRVPFNLGDIAPPQIEEDKDGDAFAVSNFMHLQVSNSAIELIGLRIPAWRTAATKRDYRNALTGILHSAADGRALTVAGDLNVDPFKTVRDHQIRSVPFPDAAMYSVERPSGAWSFTNHNGANKTSIDHVLHTDSARVTDVRYIYDALGIQLAGPKSQQPISDHAVLAFTVRVA
ncbi:endonuclease/exonuclease/phosphatase family protein [Mycolicibacterium phocaicum]|uniref:endonuclease/exonuclease/phosphatase family protein n=1 Tax=Mycolicibacterium phocaicum TaxID=319706 RepID=UPI001CFA8AC7|nr:endonuclease/exonuclease/phosphatase family protein [Mycolicibacterium phocaicum]UCZ61898.1 endonuclease/exonuclease/phosphatase family protein [Mycolicibacterium phocaicum]